MGAKEGERLGDEVGVIAGDRGIGAGEGIAVSFRKKKAIEEIDRLVKRGNIVVAVGPLAQNPKEQIELCW